MKTIYSCILLIGFSCIFFNNTFSQDSTDVKHKTIEKEVKVTVEDENGSSVYHVETTTTEDGEKKVIKKKYDSLEEMQTDSGMDFESIGDDESYLSMKLNDKGIKVIVYTQEDGETFEVEMDELPEDMDWVEKKEDGHKVIESSGGRMMFFSEGEDDSDQVFSFGTHSGDSDHVVKHYKVKVISDEDESGQKILKHENVFVIKDEDGNITMNPGDKEQVKVWVDEEGNKSVRRSVIVKKKEASFSEARIEPAFPGDESLADFNLSEVPELSLKHINYYPNPNRGEFTLTFSATKKPVIVRILDMNGNMRLERNMEDFEGTFNQVLNVRDLEKGTYLLQIFQKEKVLNRKLILE